MKKLLLASVGVVAMATAAAAADLPARYPAQAPAYVAAVYNWTGFYVGAHVGWARVDLDSTVVAAPPGFGTGGLGGSSDDGFLGGGQVGFNYQVGVWVFGIEGDIAWTDIGRSGTFAPLPGVLVTDSVGVDWLATVTGRIGYAFGNALVYAKGGVAWMDWSSNVTVTGLVGGPFTATGGATETGWTVGAGLEYGFTPNWSAKIEYNYLDFGSERTAAGGFAVDTDLSTHIVKAGINYRFDGYR
jgi:outer membrane immunogenic protein